MEKNILENYLQQKMSYQKISDKEGISKSKVKYWVDKYSLQELSTFNKEYQKDVDHKLFNKIDSKEKAYLVGFMLGDGYININGDVSFGVSIKDKKLLYDISNWFPWETKVELDLKLDRKTKRFPRARLNIRSRGIGRDLIKHMGNRLKSNRRVPILSKQYELYLLSGFFDADGCITWGYRKDRNRLWHKISFTASESILIGIQQLLIKHEISTIIRPKKNENASIIEFANKKDIIKFSKILPVDSIRLNRKVKKLKELIDELDR